MMRERAPTSVTTSVESSLHRCKMRLSAGLTLPLSYAHARTRTHTESPVDRLICTPDIHTHTHTPGKHEILMMTTTTTAVFRRYSRWANKRAIGWDNEQLRAVSHTDYVVASREQTSSSSEKQRTELFIYICLLVVGCMHGQIISIVAYNCYARKHTQNTHFPIVLLRCVTHTLHCVCLCFLTFRAFLPFFRTNIKQNANDIVLRPKTNNWKNVYIVCSLARKGRRRMTTVLI